MNLPILKKSNRTREFNSRNKELICSVVYEYLFNSLSHRELDEYILEINHEKRLGFESMNILHYLGLSKEFKGIFNGYNNLDVLKILNESGQEYNEVRELLIYYFMGNEDETTDEVENSILEGGKKKYYVKKYERNPILREQAIKIHGYKCEACGFDFYDVYGEIGKNFIEVHHKKPLYTLKEKVIVDPKEDLACLCSNCHRMIHRDKTKILTVEELKKIITH